MKVHYWESEKGNFGDDLNLWLWQELVDLDDKPFDMLLGVGTILEQSTMTGNYCVLGSGVGYGELPTQFDESRIFWVRGPLSARMLGISDSYAKGDPAILIPDLISKKGATGKTIFVPHVANVDRVDWPRVCEEAGITYVNPTENSKLVIDQIATAELVLAESMHAAIIADTYRVRWVPVWTTNEISLFKWLDWALTLDICFEPVKLKPFSLISYIDSKVSAYVANNHADILDDVKDIDKEEIVSKFAENLAHRCSSMNRYRRKNYLRIRKRLILPIIKCFLSKLDRKLQLTRAAQLSKLKKHKGYLSSSSKLEEVKSDMYMEILAFNSLVQSNQDS